MYTKIYNGYKRLKLINIISQLINCVTISQNRIIIIIRDEKRTPIGVSDSNHDSTCISLYLHISLACGECKSGVL